MNALGTFQPGNTTSFRVLTGGGNIDVTNLALRVTLQPQKLESTTTTNHLNEANYFKAARDNTNTESFYGAPLQVETSDMQTPAFLLFNRHALIRNLTVQLNGTSLERYSGIFLEYGHKACLDRLSNGVLNEAPIFSYITESESILLEPYCQDQLRMYPLTSDANIEIIIPLRDNVLVRNGIFYVGRAALELNVTFHTDTVMQKAFLQNPRTPDPTNGATTSQTFNFPINFLTGNLNFQMTLNSFSQLLERCQEDCKSLGCSVQIPVDLLSSSSMKSATQSEVSC